LKSDPLNCHHVHTFERYQSFKAGLDLKAKTMIAIHWGTIDLSEEPLFEPAELFKKVGLEKKFDSKRLWIMKIGETVALE